MTTIARNNESATTIRLAQPSDAAAVCTIYAPYVRDTAITFDLDAPSVEEMEQKIIHTLEERPFLVAERVVGSAEKLGASIGAKNTDAQSEGDVQGEDVCNESVHDEGNANNEDGTCGEERIVIGFSYASAFRPRKAYLHSIETSVYLAPEAKGAGLGSRLYEALENILRLQNVFNTNACITSINPPDETCPLTSKNFHQRRGYVQCAHIPNCGRKFHRWYDIIWMQKQLLPLTQEPEPFIPLPELDAGAVARILEQA